jgi:hypothetical protein
METRIAETRKRPGVFYAVSDDGIELPVIDITNPAFAFDAGEPALTAVIDETLADLARFRTMSPEEIRARAQQSILLRRGLQARGSFLDGMATYLHKIGPENLGSGYASDWDRRAAGQLLPLAFRHRLQTVARLLADALLSEVRDHPGPLRLLNIGGGTALDSLNALILIGQEDPALLAGRTTSVLVLDVDESGPAFGGRALAALRSPGGPLQDFDIRLRAVSYDWAESWELEAALRGARPGDPTEAAAGRAEIDERPPADDQVIVAGSSEGGLFEYGTDEQIVANLTVLHELTPRAAVFVGALLQDRATLAPRLKWIGDASGIAVRLLGLPALRSLAQAAGWTVDRVVDGPIHHIVTLRKTG